jgi:hypothetical protein
MFNKYGKKVLSLAMASAMVASMSISAFADSYETNVEATYSEPVIDVSVPQDTSAVINPYGLPTEVGQLADKSAVKVSGQQIASKSMQVMNQGETALSVGATVKITLGEKTDMTIVAKAPTSRSTAKEVYAQLQMVSSSVAEKSDATTFADDVLKDFAAANWDNGSSLTLTSDAAGATGSGLVTLAAVKSVAGKVYEYDTGSIAHVRLTGTVVESPTTAWSETNDTFTANIAFTFRPASD